jgi:hypothetical protein
MVAPVSAGRNLRRLRALGLEGSFGLYEAADFTPTRVAGEGSFEPVRFFMAHHLGMSLLALTTRCGHYHGKRIFIPSGHG